jgi:hypothetical protein
MLNLFLGLSSVASAQHAVAPTGYYPGGYDGDAWTGGLSAVDDKKREIAPTYVDPKPYPPATSLRTTHRHLLRRELDSAAGRAQQRDDFALVPPVNAEVAFINGDDEVARIKLAHPDDTQVRQVRPAILVTAGKVGQGLEIA